MNPEVYVSDMTGHLPLDLFRIARFRLAREARRRWGDVPLRFRITRCLISDDPLFVPTYRVVVHRGELLAQPRK